jgi:hypothetical protein
MLRHAILRLSGRSSAKADAKPGTSRLTFAPYVRQSDKHPARLMTLRVTAGAVDVDDPAQAMKHTASQSLMPFEQAIIDAEQAATEAKRAAKEAAVSHARPPTAGSTRRGHAQCGIRWYPAGSGWTHCHICGQALIYTTDRDAKPRECPGRRP